MLGDSPGTAAAGVEKAKRWAVLLVGGAAVQQLGWWSLYSELGLWCGLLGGAAVLVGALGFDCGVAHSVHWNCMSRPYTAEERREENERRTAAASALASRLMPRGFMSSAITRWRPSEMMETCK